MVLCTPVVAVPLSFQILSSLSVNPAKTVNLIALLKYSYFNYSIKILSFEFLFHLSLVGFYYFLPLADFGFNPLFM